MGIRYRIPFKDNVNNSYVVEVHREDYNGEPTTLKGARSCFVVSGTDEDFVYTPIRTSTATINVIDSDLLLDLYSINNQYAPVKLYKNGVLEWTGYVKPEQFTQPNTPNPQNISLECVSCLSSLEHMNYDKPSYRGVVTMWSLLQTLISKANGGYRGIYIPWVYSESSTTIGNVFEKMTLIENNFIKEEMNLLEVLEAVCKFLNWTVFELNGCLYFVDADWKGNYRLYDGELNSYTEVGGNELSVQGIGYNGSDTNTLDIVPGFNKASVKAINNVFDDVVKDEPCDILERYVQDDLVFTYKGGDGSHGVRKRFLKPMFWSLYARYSDGSIIPNSVVDGYSLTQLNSMLGAVLMQEADYKCVSLDNNQPGEGVTDFNWVDSVQIRVSSTSTAQLPTATALMPAIIMKGENAVYSDCAISIDGTIEAYFDDNMAGPVQAVWGGVSKNITASVSCGGKYYNGTTWVDSYASFPIEIDDNGKIKSTRTPFTPYKNINGFLIPMDFFVGQPEITIFCPLFLDENGTHYNTGVKIRNLTFGYAKKEGVVEEGENGDRIYENIVNDKYMSEADEITFEISSYNADGASFSKVLMDGMWLTSNLYYQGLKAYIRPEELMIRRIVNRYDNVKIKLTQSLKMADVTPITSLSDITMVNKKFILTSGEWDYEQNRMLIQMQEDIS